MASVPKATAATPATPSAATATTTPVDPLVGIWRWRPDTSGPLICYLMVGVDDKGKFSSVSWHSWGAMEFFLREITLVSLPDASYSWYSDQSMPSSFGGGFPRAPAANSGKLTVGSDKNGLPTITSSKRLCPGFRTTPDRITYSQLSLEEAVALELLLPFQFRFLRLSWLTDWAGH